jgi:hypothetical protein
VKVKKYKNKPSGTVQHWKLERSHYLSMETNTVNDLRRVCNKYGDCVTTGGQ